MISRNLAQRWVSAAFGMMFSAMTAHGDYIAPGRRPEIGLKQAAASVMAFLAREGWAPDAYIDRATLFGDRGRPWLLWVASPSARYRILEVGMDGKVRNACKRAFEKGSRLTPNDRRALW